MIWWVKSLKLLHIIAVWWVKVLMSLIWLLVITSMSNYSVWYLISWWYCFNVWLSFTSLLIRHLLILNFRLLAFVFWYQLKRVLLRCLVSLNLTLQICCITVSFIFLFWCYLLAYIKRVTIFVEIFITQLVKVILSCGLLLLDCLNLRSTWIQLRSLLRSFVVA